MKLFQKFYPLTATPYQYTDEYVEILPCDELKPYIRCFWGSPYPILLSDLSVGKTTLVTPDLCADIIFTVNYTDGTIKSSFCGIADQTFVAPSMYSGIQKKSVFGVRFYAWSAVLFSDENMKGTKNHFGDAGAFFEGFKRIMEACLFEQDRIKPRCRIAEKYLLESLESHRENSLFMRAIGQMIKENGNQKVLELASDMHISSRQMERVFMENMGVTPKKAMDLIRYQCLWQEVCRDKHFNIMDAVYQYGYTDQAHLLNDFRKKHGLSLRKAIMHAENVEYLQEKPNVTG